MDAKHISPFIKSVQNVFATMLQLPVEIGDPSIKNSSDASFDVSGIIGMSGDVVGSVVISFPTATAERVVALFTDEELTSDHEDFADAIGEIVNMVSGGAKGLIEGKSISISCPSVVHGANHTVSRPKDIPCVMIPCDTDCGNFVIEVAIQEVASASIAQKTAAAA